MGKKEDLLQAFERNRTETIIELLNDSIFSDGGDSVKNYFGETPLFAAVKSGFNEVAELLISKGADVNFKNKYGERLISQAMQKGMRKTVQLIITKGFNIHDYGVETIILTADKGWIEIVEKLLAKGIDINAKDYDGNTPLHKAVERGNYELTEFLISRGADVNIKSIGREHKPEKTPLEIASKRGFFEIAELLMTKGADVNLNCRYVGWPLSMAAISGNVEIAKLLISKGANVNCIDSEQNPLHMAVLGGNIEMVKYLVDNGADIDLKNESTGTPIHIAASQDNRDIFDFLISKGADINICTRYATTPLYQAVKNGNYEITSFLISKGADVNVKGHSETTPLHEAFIERSQDREKFYKIVELLIANGANVNAKDTQFGYTPLHWIHRNEINFINLLVDNGADLYATNNEGEVPSCTVFKDGDLRSIEFTFRKAIKSQKPIDSVFLSNSVDFNIKVKRYFEIFNDCLKYTSESQETDRTTKYTSGKYIHNFSPAINAIVSIASKGTPIAYNILHLLEQVKNIEVVIGWSCRDSLKGQLDFSPVRKKAEEELQKRGNPQYDSQAFLDVGAY